VMCSVHSAERNHFFGSHSANPGFHFLYHNIPNFGRFINGSRSRQSDPDEHEILISCLRADQPTRSSCHTLAWFGADLEDNLLVALGDLSLVVASTLPVTQAPTAPARSPAAESTVSPGTAVSAPASCPVCCSAVHFQHADTEVGKLELEGTVTSGSDGRVCRCHDLCLARGVVAVVARCCQNSQGGSGSCRYTLERDGDGNVAGSVVHCCLEHVRSSLVVVSGHIVCGPEVTASGRQSLGHEVVTHELEHVPRSRHDVLGGVCCEADHVGCPLIAVQVLQCWGVGCANDHV
jgi:hypothetical protein